MENLLKGTRVYTIGSMEYEDGQGWRNEVKDALNPLGITVFDPYHKPFVNEIKEDNDARYTLKHWMETNDFEKVSARMKEVRRDDLRLVDISDFFIVYINPKIPSWGSAEEIYWANRLKKPIFLFVEGGKNKTPLWIMGTIPHKYIYNNLQEIIDLLISIDAGKKKLDSTRWRLLRPEFR
jgi:nucleoside 2-deoxyribosyltransferase